MEGQNGRKRWRSRGQEKGGRADEHRERGDVRKGTEDRKLGHSHTKTDSSALVFITRGLPGVS